MAVRTIQEQIDEANLLSGIFGHRPLKLGGVVTETETELVRN